MNLVTKVYKMTQAFPAHENYGLTSQIRKAAISIPSNIAEGAARQTRKEFIHFLYISKASLSELDTQVDLANRLNYIQTAEDSQLNNKMIQVDKMLSGLIRKLKDSEKTRSQK